MKIDSLELIPGRELWHRSAWRLDLTDRVFAIARRTDARAASRTLTSHNTPCGVARRGRVVRDPGRRAISS